MGCIVRRFPKPTYTCCSSINAILDQFFHDRTKVNDDLTRLYLMNLKKLDKTTNWENLGLYRASINLLYSSHAQDSHEDLRRRDNNPVMGG